MDSPGKAPARAALEAAAALLAATAVCDGLGYPAASFYLLVAGVPVTAIAGLACFGRVVDEGGRGRLQAILLGLLVAVVVFGAAARGPSLDEGTVPSAATVALALGCALLAVQAVLALLPFGRHR